MGEPSPKKSKSSYNQWRSRPSNKAVLEAGLKGFLCTTNFSEKGSIREAYNLLNSTAEKLYPTEEIVEETSKNADIIDDLDAEISTLKPDKGKKEWRFQSVDTGAKNIVFIKTTLDDPVLLANTIANEINDNKDQMTQNLIRMVPIEAISKVTLEAVSSAIDPILDKHFAGEPKSFGIVVNKRLNNGADKMEFINKIASMVTAKNVEHKVNLKIPDVTILLEIIKSWCLMSVLPDFNRLKKYNLVELSVPPGEENPEIIKDTKTE